MLCTQISIYTTKFTDINIGRKEDFVKFGNKLSMWKCVSSLKFEYIINGQAKIGIS